jgi:hypothetical protein
MKSTSESCFNDCEITSYTTSSASEFWINEVSFLGHVISPEGIIVDPSKVRDVLNWKLPTSVHQVHSFLGLAGYYRRFIPNFSKIAKTITELLKKETSMSGAKLVMMPFRH